MSFVPEDELKDKSGINFAPMIDFLFLMLAFFACMSVSRITIRDTGIDLVEIKSEPNAILTQVATDTNVIRINIDADNTYTWVSDLRDYVMINADAIHEELSHQYDKGLLGENKNSTKVLLKIDKEANWEPILKAVFAIRDAGFEARPVYEPEESNKIIAEN